MDMGLEPWPLCVADDDNCHSPLRQVLLRAQGSCPW
jgi:hypothetical protein